MTLYGFHARRTPHPIIDLALFKIPTFTISVLGGGLFRIGMGALPFLLPLMLQIGFGLSPLTSGLLTFASAAGAFAMKAAAGPIIRAIGFRRILVVNAAIGGLFLIGYGLSRITVEFFREPDPQLGFLFAGATMGQLLSLPMILGGLWLMWTAKRRRVRVEATAGTASVA
jgi:hypothetical protein